MIFLVKFLENWGYDNFSHRNARVTKLWSHDNIYNIIWHTWLNCVRDVLDRNYDVIIENTFILKRPRVANFANIRQFRPKLVHQNESFYCTPIEIALKCNSTRGRATFYNQPFLNYAGFSTINCTVFRQNKYINIRGFSRIFITEQRFLASKKYKKLQF